VRSAIILSLVKLQFVSTPFLKVPKMISETKRYCNNFGTDVLKETVLNPERANMRELNIFQSFNLNIPRFQKFFTLVCLKCTIGELFLFFS